MNEHTTIDPTTGTDNALEVRKARAKLYADLDLRLAIRKANPTRTWADEVDLAPIRHTRP